jgi:hypothetical protein
LEYTIKKKEGLPMKNIILGFFLIVLLGIGIVREPIKETADFIAGASTDTYGTQIDLIAGVSDGGYSEDSLGS